MIKALYKKIISEKVRLDIRYLAGKITAPLYRGTRYYCNCCHQNFSTFLRKGNIIRTNAECPSCGSLERTRLLLFYLQRETNIFLYPTKLLHIAPERALTPIFRRHKHIEYVDGDINSAYASNIIDITKINYPENFFDVIICAHVLGHIPEEETAIQELFRVLKKGGYAIIMTLISHNEHTYENDKILSDRERLTHYGESDLCRLHGQDFASRLEKQNFNVERIDYRIPFNTAEQLRYSLGDGNRELIFKCFK